MKTNKKLINKRKWYVLLAVFFAGALAIGITAKLTTNRLQAPISLIQPVSAQISPNFKPKTMLTEVLDLVREANLNEYEAWAIINCESKWKPDAVGVNKNSYDLGLWQINSVHKDISNADKMDYLKATKWAIEKRIKDGNWNSWICKF